MSPKVFNANVGMNGNLIDPQLFHNSPHTFCLWVTRENYRLIKNIFTFEPYKEVLSFFGNKKALFPIYFLFYFLHITI